MYVKTVRRALTLKPWNFTLSSTKGIRYLVSLWEGKVPAVGSSLQLILSESDVHWERTQMPTTICWRSCILSFWKNWDLLSTLTSPGFAPAFPYKALSPMLHLGLHPLIPQGSFNSLLHSDSQFGQKPFWSMPSLTEYFTAIPLTWWRAFFPCFETYTDFSTFLHSFGYFDGIWEGNRN